MKSENKRISAARAATGSVIFSFLAVTAFGVDWPPGTTKASDVVLGSDSALLETGDVTVPAGGAEAGTLTVKQEPCATQTFSGGAIAFGSAAVVSPGDGNLDFDTLVTADGNLTVQRTDRIYSYSGIVLPTPESSVPPVEVLQDVNLANVEPVSCTTTGEFMPGYTFSAGVVKRDGLRMEVQYQSYTASSTCLKSLKVRYEQTSAASPVTAQVVYGKYIYGNQCGMDLAVGTDTDADCFGVGQPGVNFYANQIGKDPTYGVNGASFQLNRPTVTFNGVPSVAGTFKGTAAVVTDVNFTNVAQATYTTPLSVFGSMVFHTALPTLTFQPSSVVCAGINKPDPALTFAAASGATDSELSKTYAFSGEESFYPSAWTLVFPNQLLSNLTGVTDGRMGGGSAGVPKGEDSVPAAIRFYRNNGLEASFQLSVDVDTGRGTNLFKVVLVKLRQGIRGIELSSPTAGYVRAARTDHPNGYDVLTYGWVAGQNWEPAKVNYNAKSALYRFAKAPRVIVPAYALANSSATGFYGKSVRLDSSDDTLLWCQPGDEGVGFAFSNSDDCILDLSDGSVLVTLTKSLSLSKTGVRISSGSVYMPGSQTLVYANKHVVDGGSILLGSDMASDNRYAQGADSAVYIGQLELRAGRIAGAAPRFGIGGSGSSVWTVAGNAPSSVDNGILIFSPRDAAGTVTFDVSDVTSDAAADLVIGGGLLPCGDVFLAHYNLSEVDKTGAGTLRIDGTNKYANAINVKAGAIAFSADGGMGADGVYRLDGGGLSFAAGTANVVKTLEVTAKGGNVILGEGAEFTVPSASALTLNGILEVTQPEGASFKVGSKVSDAQVRMIRVNGRRVIQNPDGSFGRGGFRIMVR